MISTDVRLVTYRALPQGEPDTPLIRQALLEYGLEMDVAVWDDPSVDWASARITILRSTWDYHLDRGRFLDWADGVARHTALHNPPSILRWNSHKGYLSDLERMGLAVVPTVLVRAGDRPPMASLLAGRDWSAIVFKPAVSLDGHGVERGDASDPAILARIHRLAADADVIVQPYIGSIVEDGEISITFIEGIARHAVRKRPAAGDFRVQTRLGGSVAPASIPPGAREIGGAALAVLDTTPLYARVDLIEDGSGWRVTELELIEPSLFMVHAPESATHFAAAIVARL